MGNQEQPLVTIGVLSYNNAKFIAETLESIRNQTYPAIELIVIDDCSCDNSIEVIENWMTSHAFPCIFIKNNKNLGLAGACNVLVQKARGKYVCWIGSDDILRHDKIAIQTEAFEKMDESIGAVYSNSFLINAEGEKYDKNFHQQFNPGYLSNIPEGDLTLPLVQDFYLPAVTTMIRKATFAETGMYDTTLFSEDLDMWLRICRKFQFRYIDDCLTYYRIHDLAATSNKRYLLSETFIKIYKKYKAVPYHPEIKDAFRRKLVIQAENLYAFQAGDFKQALLYAFKETQELKLLLFFGLSSLRVKHHSLLRFFKLLKGAK